MYCRYCKFDVAGLMRLYVEAIGGNGRRQIHFISPILNGYYEGDRAPDLERLQFEIFLSSGLMFVSGAVRVPMSPLTPRPVGPAG